MITGCVSQCGEENQACVTACQVCVEQHHCHELGLDCPTCMAKVQDLTLRSYVADDLVVDSGGKSLKYDDARNHFRVTKMAWLGRKEELREARNAVLEAQRQVEWADEEHKEEIARLHAARDGLKGARREADKWDLSEHQILKVLERKTADARIRQKEDQGQPAATRKRRRELREAARELQREQREADVVWRGMRSRIHDAREKLELSIDGAVHAHALERLSAERLRRSKAHYLRLALEAQRDEKEMLRLEGRMAKLSPANTTEMLHPVDSHADRWASSVALITLLCVAVTGAHFVLT